MKRIRADYLKIIRLNPQNLFHPFCYPVLYAMKTEKIRVQSKGENQIKPTLSQSTPSKHST